MIKEEELNEWISEFHPTVETEIIEVLRARVQYAILDELNSFAFSINNNQKPKVDIYDGHSALDVAIKIIKNFN